MFLSVFDIFKIGIGPSSSHTMGPMVAAGRFLDALRASPARATPSQLRCVLRGSLAFTGHGHGTDRAIIWGLSGLQPETLDLDDAQALEARVRAECCVNPNGLTRLAFDPTQDLVFDFGAPLPGHANGLILQAFDERGELQLEEIYYSIGGGFVVTADELAQLAHNGVQQLRSDQTEAGYPYPFGSAADMLVMGTASGLSIAAMKRANECVVMDSETLNQRLDHLWDAMNSCISRGLATQGELPGGLKVKRRAWRIQTQLEAERHAPAALPHGPNDWLSAYAMAVNEENAAGSRVVTAPTNGAAGVVPAVLRYYRQHCSGATDDGVRDFLLTAAAIGGLIKHNASISGAEVGCQGEVGSAAAMAAAGLCAALGGSNAQVENAAEIALEHHLGMTCDPAAGLVQVPCIERNAMGAIKAVAAASLALRGNGEHYMPLDNCIETMRQTGLDMSERYKETSTGGLAVNLPNC